jgi:pimeloyl-ACP methyl ester carboxylesterase
VRIGKSGDEFTPRAGRSKGAARHLRVSSGGLAALLLALALTVAAPRAHAEDFVLRDGARSFSVTVLRPAGAPVGTVVLAHGFLRDGASLAALAGELAAAGALVLVPELPHHADAVANARALREVVAAVRSGALGPVPARTVLIGFSFGGLASFLAAATTPGLTGWIGLDPVDSGAEGLHAAARVSSPAVIFRATAHACNAYANSFAWNSFAPRLERDVLIDNATHCDFEDDALVCGALCGAADPARKAAIRAAVVAQAVAWLR